MKKITRSQLVEELIPTPSLHEQRRLAGRLGSRLSQVDELLQSLTRQMQLIDELPAAFLRQAFAGERLR